MDTISRLFGLGNGNDIVFGEREMPALMPSAVVEDWKTLMAQSMIDPKLNSFQRVFTHVAERPVSLSFDGRWRASPAQTWTDAFGYPNEVFRFNMYIKGEGWGFVLLPRLHVVLQNVVWNRDSHGIPYAMLRAQVPLYRDNSNPGRITLPPISQWACEALEVVAAAFDEEGARTDNENDGANPMRVVQFNLGSFHQTRRLL